MSAVTDTECEVRYDKVNKPGISNLMVIYSSLKNISLDEVEAEFKGANYGTFKKAVADIVCETIAPLQAKYHEIISSSLIDEVLAQGAKKASSIANGTIAKVKKVIGLYDKQ
jgi:tryptophanyl-tRNA synthetase